MNIDPTRCVKQYQHAFSRLYFNLQTPNQESQSACGSCIIAKWIDLVKGLWSSRIYARSGCALLPLSQEFIYMNTFSLVLGCNFKKLVVKWNQNGVMYFSPMALHEAIHVVSTHHIMAYNHFLSYRIAHDGQILLERYNWYTQFIMPWSPR